MLHVTNGDAAAAALAAAGFEDVLPWRDILHEGPVPDVPEDALRRTRAHFLAKTYELDRAQVLRDLEERDARLAAAGEVTLWFESDLVDDLQRMQISHQLGDRPARLVLIDETPWRAVAQLGPEELRAASKQAVEAPDLRAEWAAVRSPDPRGVTHARYREQFPWTTDGLNRSERQLKEAMEVSESKEEAYLRAQQREEKPFLGDTTAYLYLARLADPARKYSLGGAMATMWRYDPVTRAVQPASGA